MRNILLVLNKEVRDLLRDKRSRSAMLIGPFFSVILTFGLFGLLGSSIKSASKSTLHVVAGSRGSTEKQVILALEKTGVKIKEVESRAAGETLIKTDKASVVLDFGKGLDETIQSNKPAKLVALYDESNQKAQISLSMIESLTQKVNEGVVKSVFSAKGVDPEFSTPLRLERLKVQVGETSSSEILIQILPYLIVIWAFYGAFGVSSDIVAGEKERQTLETLLISPAKRMEIAVGKLLALFVAGFTSALVSIIAVGIAMQIKFPGSEVLMGKGVGLTATGVFAIVAVLVPTVFLFASGLLAISSFAKNTREAQTYLAQASFLVVMPAMFSQVIGFTGADKARWVSFVPVLNTANTIREALAGRYDLIGVGITVVLGLTLSALALTYAIKMFNREEVLTRI